ncbi:hypothetical protein GGF47_000070 [Coemansia sp. RSA 2524]|nr:hypothetical protein LPJ54_000039 [Coemansia sp. RSA 1824]KAJ2258104.1 hypothetical protein GGH98_000406 [Coemansia sp. RSA 454]KAJ2430381.1 hypothetical protein GGF47_000070 [Coemansia sp. RSA 2524]
MAPETTKNPTDSGLPVREDHSDVSPAQAHTIKTYAAVAAEAAETTDTPVAEITAADTIDSEMESDSQTSEQTSEQTSDYTSTDEYDDTDAYTESVFSDNEGAEVDLLVPESNRKADTGAEALAPAHRFVSQTPWGAATGRLTRDQRQKERLWDAPPVPRSSEHETQGPGLKTSAIVHDASDSHSQASLSRQQQLQRVQQEMYRKQMQPNTIPGTRIVTIAQFIKSLSRLLGIGIPGVRSTEARLAAALVAILGIRTCLDVWFANFNARIVRAVVTYDRSTLLRRLLPEYLLMMLPMSVVNQAIKWTISSLTIAMRVRLAHFAHSRYVDGITNITWNQLHHHGPPPANERPDWLLTVQIHRFADMVPRLLADVVKPTLDWFVFSRLLSRFIGRRGSLTMVAYVIIANVVIRMASPAPGTHAAQLSMLEEKYQNVYARISSAIQGAAASTPVFGESGAATPIAPRVQPEFRERATRALDASLSAVSSTIARTNLRRFAGGIGESVLAKYGATLVAYFLLSRPVCSPTRRLASEIMHDPAAVMMSYSRNSAYLINLAQATTRLLLMVGDLPKFVWSTVKVDRLLRSLDVHSRYRSAVDIHRPASEYSSD